MTAPANYLVRYTSRATVNGEPVGDVYVVDVSYVSPGAFSYTKDPAEATTFSKQEAEGLLLKWDAAVLVALTDAQVLV